MRYIQTNSNQKINANLFFEDLRRQQPELSAKALLRLSPNIAYPWIAEEDIRKGDMDAVLKAFSFSLDYTCHNSETERIHITSYDNLIKLRDAINNMAASYEKIIGEFVDDMTTVKEQAAAQVYPWTKGKEMSKYLVKNMSKVTSHPHVVDYDSTIHGRPLFSWRFFCYK